jgi:phospholipase C
VQAADKIKHVVVLMLENRSFDHLVGYMRSGQYPIDGLLGTEFNPVTPGDPASANVPVSSDAPYVPDLNPSPGHDIRNVKVQLYAGSPDDKARNLGFVYDYAQQTGVSAAQAAYVMRCFSPAKLPVITTLAREFAICDHWYSSLPGPTWPNRLFVHAATSGGYTDNNPHNYTMRTVFENISDVGKAWRVYFHDTPQSLMLANLRNLRYLKFFEHVDAFARDCRQAQLPDYSFIEPRYFTALGNAANDQHPDHGVLPGEQLIADVYNALSASPLWKQSLLVIVWDEHGGFYDHVIPPAAVNPDGKVSPEFDFKTLGLRVPAVLVSPWIVPQTIDSAPYDHSSVPATLKKLFGLRDFLTARDRAANTFERVCALDAPRADIPSVTPAVSIASALTTTVQLATADSRPPSDLQASLVALSNEINAAPPPPSALTSEHDAGQHVAQTTATLLSSGS